MGASSPRLKSATRGRTQCCPLRRSRDEAVPRRLRDSVALGARRRGPGERPFWRGGRGHGLRSRCALRRIRRGARGGPRSRVLSAGSALRVLAALLLLSALPLRLARQLVRGTVLRREVGADLRLHHSCRRPLNLSSASPPPLRGPVRASPRSGPGGG